MRSAMVQQGAGILEKTAPRMNAKQRESIVDYLKMHAPPPEPEPVQ